MALTIGGLISEARTVLNDVVPTGGDGEGTTTRYSDADLVQYLNDAFLLARAKRPDLFLGVGASMQAAVTQYVMPDNASTPFPLDPMTYPGFLYYVVGFAELREDTFSDDSRAVTMLNKFVSGLIQVAS